MPTMERVLVYKPDADAVASSSTIAIQNESESSNSDDTALTPPKDNWRKQGLKLVVLGIVYLSINNTYKRF
jgi:hypothetical protein